MTSTGVEAFRDMTERQRLDILQALIVGHALGGGTVPEWVPLDTRAESAVKDIEQRDATQTGHITAYLRGCGVEWDGPEDGRVIDIVCRAVEHLRTRVMDVERWREIQHELRTAVSGERMRKLYAERDQIVARQKARTT